MKFLATTLALSLASVACVGSIPGGDGKGPQGNGPGGSNPGGNGGGNSGGPGVTPIPPENMVPVQVGMCNEGTLARPRVWRLTHSQVRNMLRDTLAFAPPAVDGFPVEARIDATTSRNGFANRSDELKISPLLADTTSRPARSWPPRWPPRPPPTGSPARWPAWAPGDCLQHLHHRASAPRCGAGR